MNRRDTVFALLALGASPLAAEAQQARKVWRIGFLALTSGPDELVEAFREQLRALGYVEGRNLLFEFRWAAGKEERLPELAAELVRLKVDVIVTRTTFVAAAAKRATSTIPIVMASAADPVGTGVVASLARPGGNVTGVTQNATEIDAKRLHSYCVNSSPRPRASQHSSGKNPFSSRCFSSRSGRRRSRWASLSSSRR